MPAISSARNRRGDVTRPHDAVIGDEQRAPESQVARELSELLERALPEHDAGSRLKIESVHVVGNGEPTACSRLYHLMPTSQSAPRLTSTQWLICAIAAIGFAFDTYELLMLPLIVGPAIGDLVGAKAGTPEYANWVSQLFFVPAIFGGIFGLLGGYLTDRFGRRRVLTWSILLYAFSAFGAGFTTNIYWLLVLRCTTFIGVCVEFVAATAWLAELFSDPKQRERVLGYTQAFGSVGGLLVTVVYGLAVSWSSSLPAIAGSHAPWRYTLISGIIPALPLIIIRPFLPESPIWREKKAAGTLKRPSIGELFAPRFAKTTIVTTIMFACSFGAAFGAIQHMPRIVPGIEEVRTLPPAAREHVVKDVQLFQEIRRTARPNPACRAGRQDRCQASPPLGVSGARPFCRADRLLLCGGRFARLGQVGHLRRGALHGRAVQLLG